MTNNGNLWSVSATIPQHDLTRVEEILIQALGNGSGRQDKTGDTILAVTTNTISSSTASEADQLWRVEFLCSEEPNIEDLASACRELNSTGISIKPRIQRVPNQDWVIASQQMDKPVRAGRYFIHTSHYGGAKPPGAIRLVVDAGPAFGTGTHESTYGCLIALDDLAKRIQISNPLDLGTGTGILSMAVSRTWRCRVLAVDIDPCAIEFARATATLNNLHRHMELMVSEGCQHQRVIRGKPYDLIVANILAGPLIWMAGDIWRHLAPGGRVILSGLLQHQERRVLAPYRLNRMVLEKRIRIRGWSTLMLRAPSRLRRKSLLRPTGPVLLPDSSEIPFL
jgi:ribosomal protein L11 methyltransferase